MELFGNRSNEIPWNWHQGQLQGQAGFLVSRNLTLSSAHVSTVSGIRHSEDFPHMPKKKQLGTGAKLIPCEYVYLTSPEDL